VGAEFPPEQLSSRQRTLFWVVAAVAAVSRFAAMARSAWDWDEMLFSLGMREYDVTSHHPHPPGFPLYIAAAKIVRLVADSDFRALQSINLLAGVLAFPAVFLLARELRLRYETSMVAGALFVFLPNVWFFGGAAFSDVPSIVLAIYAALFLFRGRRSSRDYLIGAFLLAIAAGVRPQNLLVGVFPGLLAMRRRPALVSVCALLIGIAICAAAYGGAAWATGGWDRYINAVRWHSEYIARVDSFRSENRPPLWRIFDRFFIKQYQSAALSIVTSLFVAVSVIGSIRGRDRSMLRNVLTFGPVAVLTWLMLDRYSISRFSIGYQPMFALLAADGIRRVAERLRRRHLEYAIGGALIVAFILYAFPAMAPVRNEVTPPVQAVQKVLGTFNPATQQLYVAYSMVPFMEYLAPGFPMIRLGDDRAVPVGEPSNGFLLADLTSAPNTGATFQRERGALWNIARRHYFEVSLAPFTSVADFESGWYQAEREGEHEWRVMRDRAVIVLPARSSPSEVGLVLDVPGELEGSVITVTINGVLRDRITMAHGENIREYTVASGEDARVHLASDRTAVIDGRERGPRLRGLHWGRP
jgi:hypothetical protein